jgi:hypothetical protein
MNPETEGNVHRTQHLQRRFALVALLVLLIPVAASQRASPAAAQDTAHGINTTVLSDITLVPPAERVTMSVTLLTLSASNRTESMVLKTPIVIVLQGGAIKLWTRAGTTIDGIPVTESPTTVFIDKQQTIVIPGKTRFRIRAQGCAPARLLFIALTG